MTRAGFLALGSVTLAALWLGPLPELARHRFSAHMTLHMGVVAVAAPVLALGFAGASFDPARRFPLLFSAIPASVVELAVVWAWHAPALHHAARSATIAFVAEQGMFLGSGLLVWLSAFGGETRRGSRAGAGVIALLLTSVHMTLLGGLLALSPRPLYVHGQAAASAAAALADQHLGGALMLVIGGTAYLAGGLWLSRGLLRERTLLQPRRQA